MTLFVLAFSWVASYKEPATHTGIRVKNKMLLKNWNTNILGKQAKDLQNFGHRATIDGGGLVIEKKKAYCFWQNKIFHEV